MSLQAGYSRQRDKNKQEMWPRPHFLFKHSSFRASEGQGMCGRATRNLSPHTCIPMTQLTSNISPHATAHPNPGSFDDKPVRREKKEKTSLDRNFFIPHC